MVRMKSFALSYLTIILLLLFSNNISAQLISKNDSLRIVSEERSQSLLSNKELNETISSTLPTKTRRRIDSFSLIRDNVELPIRKRLKAQDKIVMAYLYRNTNLALPELKKYLSLAEGHADSLHFLARAYHDIGYYYQKKGNIDSAKHFYQKELLFAKRRNYKGHFLNAMIDLALISEKEGNYDAALAAYLEVIDSCITKKRSNPEARARINVGALLHLKGDYLSALNHLNLALDICLLAKGLNGYLASNYLYLANVNTSIGEYERAEDYYVKALKWSDVMNNSNTKRLTFIDYINFNKEILNWKKALSLGRKLLVFEEGLNIHNNKAEGLTLMANLFNDIGEADSARHYIHQAIQLYQQIDFTEKLYQSYGVAGKIYLKERNFNKAEQFCMNSYLLSQNKNDTKQQKENCYCLYQVYKEKGKAVKSLRYFEEYVSLNTQLVDKEKAKDAVKVQLNGQFKNKQYRDSLENKRQLELQEDDYQRKTVYQKRIALGLGVGLLLIFIIAVILWYAFQQNKKQKEALTKLNQLNKQIFSIISHDFRSPLMSMNFMVEALSDTQMDEQRMRMYLKDIKNQIAQTSNILDNLLNWARAELQIDLTSKKQTQFVQISNEIVQIFEQKLKDKNLAVKIDIPQDLTLNIHPDLLRIVLRNLLSNAIKYSHENASIFLKYDVDNKCISLKDEGLGMDWEQMTMLFKQPVFSQMGTEQETGFGIGLYITYELLRKIGWDIKVESELRKGTTFFVHWNK